MAKQKNNFDKFVEKLQQEIIQQEVEEYNEYIVDLFHNPQNWGKPSDEEISISHSFRGPCNDTMEFFLKIKDNKIIKANFITDGCGASVAAGSQTTLMIEGKSLEFAEKLTPEELDETLHGLPDDHKHCAKLAIDTLKALIVKYKKNSLRKNIK